MGVVVLVNRRLARWHRERQPQRRLARCPHDPSQAELDKLTATSGSGMPAVPAEWHDNAMALWNDAVAKSKAVKAAWPYSWVDGVDYPHKDGRATVSGQLVLDDPQAVKKTLPHLTVGLAHPNYQRDAAGFQTRGGNGNIVTWPHDGNYYQFWVDGAVDGRFTIPNVRPGKYTLHAFADGVLAFAAVVFGAVFFFFFLVGLVLVVVVV